MKKTFLLASAACAFIMIYTGQSAIGGDLSFEVSDLVVAPEMAAESVMTGGIDMTHSFTIVTPNLALLAATAMADDGGDPSSVELSQKLTDTINAVAAENSTDPNQATNTQTAQIAAAVSTEGNSY